MNLITVAKEHMKNELGKKREDRTLSPAHDEGHCENVAIYGAATARALMKGQGYNSADASELSEVAGYLHDIARESTEKTPHGPASAEYFYELRGPFDSLDYMYRATVYDAIYHHEQPFGKITEIFGNPVSKRKCVLIMPTVVAHGLKTADACLEASGFRVFADRRPFFVGKERIIGPKSDITMFSHPNQSHLAVLGETMIRLYAKNPIDEYPPWLKSYAEELHAVQYLGYRALLHFAEMTEEQAADFFFQARFPKFSKELVDRMK